ncbi:tyrosine-type recombinase/integrase [Nitrospira sp. Nam74]
MFPEQERLTTEAPLFREYAARWFQTCTGKRLKHSTIQRYESALRVYLLPAFGEMRLSEIDRGKVREFANRLTLKQIRRKGIGPLAPKTIHNVIRTLSAIFTLANEENVVPHNPARNPSKLIRIVRHAPRVDVFTHAEECLILDTVKACLPAYYTFILLLFRTGLRVGEAVALKSQDVDLRSRYVYIERNFTHGHLEETPKGGRSRRVDLTRDLLAVLRDHLTLQEAEAALDGERRSPWLCQSPEGQLIRGNNFRDRIWKPLLRRLGLRYRTLQAIRHTYATRLIMADANIVYVQHQLGHSTIKLTVDTYTHWLELAKRQHTLQVDRLMDAPCEEEQPNEGVTQVVTRAHADHLNKINPLNRNEDIPLNVGVSDGFRIFDLAASCDTPDNRRRHKRRNGKRTCFLVLSLGP